MRYYSHRSYEQDTTQASQNDNIWFENSKWTVIMELRKPTWSETSIRNI